MILLHECTHQRNVTIQSLFNWKIAKRKSLLGCEIGEKAIDYREQQKKKQHQNTCRQKTIFAIGPIFVSLSHFDYGKIDYKISAHLFVAFED